jgi:hypothetical protein
MNDSRILGAILGAAALWLAVGKPAPPPAPAPVPVPVKPAPWRPLQPKPRPLNPTPSGAAGKPVIGGMVSPDGTVAVVGDLPGSLKRKNVGGTDGAGLCVFTSIEYAARFQNEPRLWDFQDKMRRERGGGWPEKVDKMVAKYAPGVQYVQHTEGDLDFLKACFKSGRPACITYGGYDPHYRGYVAHMVWMAALTDEWAAISDNNFPGENELVWMSVPELAKRWKAGGGGWAVVLLNPPPPPRTRPL